MRLGSWHPGLGPLLTPIFGITYGEYGTGKSTDTLRAFGWRSLVLALPGAMIVSETVLGVTPIVIGIDVLIALLSGQEAWPEDCPLVYEIQGLEDALLVLQAVRDADPEYRPFSVIFDDVGLQAESTHIDAKPAKMEGDASWKWWDTIKLTLGYCKFAARNAGCHVWANAHVVGPETKINPKTHVATFFKGGPKMPGPSVQEALPGIFDEMARVDHDAARMVVAKSGHILMPGGVYRVLPGNPKWHEKTRSNALYNPCPMNLREAFRAIGVPLPRMAGASMDWMDDVADEMVRRLEVAAEAEPAPAPEPAADAKKAAAKGNLLGRLKHKKAAAAASGGRVLDVSKSMIAEFGGSVPDLHLRWALQDGRDRYDFKKRGGVLDV